MCSVGAFQTFLFLREMEGQKPGENVGQGRAVRRWYRTLPARSLFAPRPLGAPWGGFVGLFENHCDISELECEQSLVISPPNNLEERNKQFEETVDTDR